jgi:putative oxidoreductase
MAICADGWGKLHHLAQITDFFRSLGTLFPTFNAHFVSDMEFISGLLLIFGTGFFYLDAAIANRGRKPA